jgi:hypothetical protein
VALYLFLVGMTALSPIEGAIAEAIADLEEREARLAAREGVLRRREGAISHALANLETTL